MQLAELDPNFAERKLLGDKTFIFYDAENEPFRIYGLMREDGHFTRMPRSVVENANRCAFLHHTDTAGARVRFVTDSDEIAIRVELEGFRKIPHMPLTGTAGFDLYATSEEYTERYCGTFIPPIDLQDGYETSVNTLDRLSKTVTINFPLWSCVKKVYVGIPEGATLSRAPDYAIEQPVLLYGSSITQGGCVSKPGSSYALILSRRLNCNIRNLGLSGGAKAEDSVIDYLCKQDMRVFILDYDHNAPDPEYLQSTHEKLFKAVRACHPDVPIIMMSRPKLYLEESYKRRREIVRQTYRNALAAGDKNVYYIDNEQLTALVGYDGMVDGIHPTDSGHLSMACAIAPVLRKILKL